MPIALPETATDASRRRAELAGQLARGCPVELAEEIALVGSTAHGLADDDSDLELNHWADAIPRSMRVSTGCGRRARPTSTLKIHPVRISPTGSRFG